MLADTPLVKQYYCYIVLDSIYVPALGSSQVYKGILPIDPENYLTLLNAGTNYLYDVATKKDIGVISFMSSNWLYVKTGWRQELNLQCLNFYDGTTISQLSIPTPPLATDSTFFKLYSQDTLGRLVSVEGEDVTVPGPDGKDVAVQVLKINIYDRPFL